MGTRQGQNLFCKYLFLSLIIRLVTSAGALSAADAPAADDAALKKQRCPKPAEFASVFSFGYGNDCMPQDDAKFEALVKMIKEGGFNVIHTSYTDKRLEICKKYGVKIMLDFLDVSQHHVYKVSQDKAKALAEKLRGNPDVWGYNIWNESFGKTGPGRERDILNVRRWDPTHPAYSGTYRNYGVRHLADSDVPGYYDYHWSRGIGHHFGNLGIYSRIAVENKSSFYRWVESKAGATGEDNMRKSLFTLNTSIACGMKGVLWFLASDYIVGINPQKPETSYDKITLPFCWTPNGQDIVKVHKEVMPLAAEVMKIGNPVAIYSTPATKDMGNAALPPDQAGKVPGGLAAFPADLWVQPAGGEFVMGVFKDNDNRDAFFVANHNALAPQDVKLKFAKAVKVSMFNRKDAKWTSMPVDNNTVSFKLEGGVGELLHLE